MSLDITKLKKVKDRTGKIIAQCPACAECGADSAGDHLAIFPNGKFGCIANQNDHAHNSRIHALAGADGASFTEAPMPARPSTPRHFEADELYRMTLPWRTRLYEHPELCRHATQWGYEDALIRSLTMPCFDSLCIVPAGQVLTLPNTLDEEGEPKSIRLRMDRLGFVYDGALKIRQPFGPKGKLRFLMIGQPRRPWRSHLLLRSECRITSVEIAEGEHDALELIECGFESFDFRNPGSAVVSVPGAGAFNPEWRPLFAGRAVTVCMDSDDAGQRFAQSVANALAGIASVTARQLKQ